MLIFGSFCTLFALAEEADLSSPLPAKERPSKKEGWGLNLELTPPIPVSPITESEEVEEAFSPENPEEKDLEEEITPQEPKRDTPTRREVEN